jgi:hypothetical protein
MRKQINIHMTIISLLIIQNISNTPFFRNLEETTTTNTNTNTDTTTSENTSVSSEIQITGSQANYTTIPTIIISMEALSAAYNLIFENLPEEQTGKDTSALDDIQSGLETYKKVRNFVVVLSSKRDEMIKDMNYIKDNMGNLGLSKYEVLGFYDLRSTYEPLLRKFKAYDPAFQAKDAYMDLEVKEFQENIGEIVKSIDIIMEAEQIVWTKTEFIRNQINESDTSTAVLSSIDTVLLLLLELLEYRKKVITQMESAMPRILDMSYKRERFIQILTDQMIFIGVDTTKDQNVGVSILNTFVIVLLACVSWIM